MLTICNSTEGDRIRGYLRERLQLGDCRGAPSQLGRAWRLVADARQTLSEVQGTNDGVFFEQLAADQRILVLREPELLGQTLKWMDNQPDANALRAAILSIDAWPDRVITRTATMAAMEHAEGRNAQSSRLICDCCKGQVTLVAMGDSGAGRTVAHTCVRCRRLVQTTMEPPSRPPFPRSCLQDHPNRCGGADYTPLRGEISWNELHDVMRMMKPNKAPGLDEVTPELLKAAPPKAKQLFLDMVNAALTTGKIPQQWRKGEVTLLAKGGDRPT